MPVRIAVVISTAVASPRAVSVQVVSGVPTSGGSPSIVYASRCDGSQTVTRSTRVWRGSWIRRAAPGPVREGGSAHECWMSGTQVAIASNSASAAQITSGVVSIVVVREVDLIAGEAGR